MDWDDAIAALAGLDWVVAAVVAKGVDWTLPAPPGFEELAQQRASCARAKVEVRVEWGYDSHTILVPMRDWVEIAGCGMVEPAVFENVGYDTSKFSGFAFGMGIERIAMILYGIDDIRYFYQNDSRFLRQFA